MRENFEINWNLIILTMFSNSMDVPWAEVYLNGGACMITKNNRGEIEILFEILQCCKTPIKKTNLLRKSGLCYPHFSLYFVYLEERNYIERIDNGSKKNSYRITESGERIITKISNLIQCLHSDAKGNVFRYDDHADKVRTI